MLESVRSRAGHPTLSERMIPQGMPKGRAALIEDFLPVRHK
jgi:hypothetical protein